MKPALFDVFSSENLHIYSGKTVIKCAITIQIWRFVCKFSILGLKKENKTVSW